MCGIVGYIGRSRAGCVMLDGLRRLEYRGYDSSGMVVCDGNGFEQIKRTGRVVNLEEALEEMVMVAEGVRAARMFRDRAVDMKIDVPFVIALNTLLDGYITAEECCRRMVALS